MRATQRTPIQTSNAVTRGNVPCRAYGNLPAVPLLARRDRSARIYACDLGPVDCKGSHQPLLAEADRIDRLTQCR